MGEIAPWLVFVAVLTALLGCLAWLAARTRRRGVGREIMGPVDVIYRPHTHQINQEIQVHEERMVAMPSPGDPSKRSRAEATGSRSGSKALNQSAEAGA
jgi:hypothetical protein